MHNFSYLRVIFALLIPDGFTQRCDHGITCHCRFRKQYNTHTHTRTYAHNTHYLCFASHKPLFRLSLNFVCIWSVTSRSNHIKTSSWYEAILVMQMKVKGQFFLCFVSQKPLVQLSLNFVCVWSVTRRSNHIKTSTWYEAILVMQMKVKGQIFLCFVSRLPVINFLPDFDML